MTYFSGNNCLICQNNGTFCRKKKPSMFTFMFLFLTHEKSKALMFLANKIKGFDVLCSYFFELQSLYVLIWPCSYKKKRVYTGSVANLMVLFGPTPYLIGIGYPNITGNFVFFKHFFGLIKKQNANTKPVLPLIKI